MSLDTFVLSVIWFEDTDIVSMTMERGLKAFVRPEFPSFTVPASEDDVIDEKGSDCTACAIYPVLSLYRNDPGVQGLIYSSETI